MIYEFECNQCHKVIEEQYKMDECPKEILCTFCGGTFKKIMSVPSKPKPIFYQATIKEDKPTEE